MSTKEQDEIKQLWILTRSGQKITDIHDATPSDIAHANYPEIEGVRDATESDIEEFYGRGQLRRKKQGKPINRTPRHGHQTRGDSRRPDKNGPR